MILVVNQYQKLARLLHVCSSEVLYCISICTVDYLLYVAAPVVTPVAAPVDRKE